MKASKDIWIASVKARVLENSELNNDGSDSEAEFVEEIKKQSLSCGWRLLRS